ncbi:DNA replication/repair protein RecF [Marinobacter halodurans]|uniref:DNA replication and repair protein RecF n=1 Tax=Marinobacter halodurans TaxID=2528979 RepID=A0ABY1ZLB4_9GAMM|nr:DNA replication/repair protein RecF [Marinobacter halodurans]TBW56460.1 DNA replication/repair protein RecF [Marinobacter halodurans]
MALLKLQTQQFRNLAPVALSFSPTVNLIYGANGSGKSSLLEAIAYLGLGRSFRVNRHEAVVRHGSPSLTVFGEVSDNTEHSDAPTPLKETHRIGISRDLGTRETRLKVDGERVRNLSAVARHLPVSVIDPGTFDIVTGGPGKRRQFLDWSVFHVEHGFAALWQQFQRAVSQRNKILRNGRIDESLLRIWDSQYIALAEQVTGARRRVFEQFQPLLESVIADVDVAWSGDLKFEFFPGWDRKADLADVLMSHRDQEAKMGHTLYGPNRADVRVKYQGRPVAETLSRGQQKTLVILMKIAQGQLLREHGRQCTFLLDDINAELDEAHRQMLAGKLRDLGSQVFITSIEPPRPELLWRDPMPDFKVFHVEHGDFTEE